MAIIWHICIPTWHCECPADKETGTARVTQGSEKQTERGVTEKAQTATSCLLGGEPEKFAPPVHT